MERLTHTSYVDRGTDHPRTGDTARRESRVDLESYLRPLERVHAGHLHGWGVAAGLEIVAVLGGASVRITPGVALDTRGRHIGLAAGGRAVIGDEDPVDVLPDGLTVPIPDEAGEWCLALAFAEIFDQAGFTNSSFTVFQFDHTPQVTWAALDGFVPDGLLVPLAEVTVVTQDAGSDPAVTAIDHRTRRGVSTPTQHVSLHRPVRAVEDGTATVGQQASAAELRARPGGGLELRVADATDRIEVGREGGSCAELSITADTVTARRGDGTPALTLRSTSGHLGVDVAEPAAPVHVPDDGLRIGRSGGADQDFSLTVGRVSGGFRALRFSTGDPGARTHLVTLTTAGHLGVGSSSPQAPLHVTSLSGPAILAERKGKRLEIHPNWSGLGRFARIATRAGDRTGLQLATNNVARLTVAAGGRVGIGTAEPRAGLHVEGAGPGGTIRVERGGKAVSLNANWGARGEFARLDTVRNSKMGLQLGTNEIARVTITSRGGVGIGTAEPRAGLHVQGAGAGGTIRVERGGKALSINANWGGQGEFARLDTVRDSGIGLQFGTDETPRLTIGQHGRVGIGALPDLRATFYVRATPLGPLAAMFEGPVQVTGPLIKPGGQFRIDHPLDPAHRYLCHSFVESDEMKNVYDGVVELDDDGSATIELPDWFEALNTRYRYQLTAVGGAAPDLHVSHRLTGNRFAIAGGPPGAEVSWQVTGVRHDPYARAHPMAVEPAKSDEARGRYLYPELYGEPADRGIGSTGAEVRA